MATEGYVKFEYFSKGVQPYYNSSGFPELLDDEKIVIETPCIEMNIHQYYGLFKKFLMSVGFEQKNIVQGACNIAFNEMNDEKIMKQVAEEYDLTMNEDIAEIIADSKKQDEEWIKKTDESWEQRYWALYNRFTKFACYSDDDLEQMIDLFDAEQVKKDMISVSDFLSENRNSNFPGENTIEKVTTNDPMKAWNGFVPGSPESQAKGCICPILDNQEMPPDKKWIDVECPLHGRKK